jgi:hypothetical protein
MKRDGRLAAAGCDAERRPTCRATCREARTNPLGARAIYLGSSLYRIHGSNEPETIGAAVSSRLHPHDERDVVDLMTGPAGTRSW